MKYFAAFVFLLVVVHCPVSGRQFSHRRRHFDDELNEISDDEDKRLALIHTRRVSEAGACDAPKPHVIHVNDHYPGKYYLPHCTVLHRCGKHAGCCGTDRLKCVAAKKEKVTLHFYSVKVDGEGHPADRRIEKLVFSNHTQCACVPIDNFSKHDL